MGSNPSWMVHLWGSWDRAKGGGEEGKNVFAYKFDTAQGSISSGATGRDCTLEASAFK